MAKKSKKIGLLLPFIVIIIIVAIVGIFFGISKYKQANELKLSNANDKLSDIATDAGLVEKGAGSFYITLYVTAGVILITGIAVFVYVYKKAEE